MFRKLRNRVLAVYRSAGSMTKVTTVIGWTFCFSATHNDAREVGAKRIHDAGNHESIDGEARDGAGCMHVPATHPSHSLRGPRRSWVLMQVPIHPAGEPQSTPQIKTDVITLHHPSPYITLSNCFGYHHRPNLLPRHPAGATLGSTRGSES